MSAATRTHGFGGSCIPIGMHKMLILMGLLALGSGGCSGVDCRSACNEAQAKDCTSIKGDCDAFCTSLERVAGPANCEAKYDAYGNCVESDEVCTASARCRSEESALDQCTGAYCLAHLGDADCKVLEASF